MIASLLTMASTRSVTRSSGAAVFGPLKLSLTGTADVGGAALGGSSVTGFSPMSGIH